MTVPSAPFQKSKRQLTEAVSGLLTQAPKGGLAPRLIFQRLGLTGRHMQEACLQALAKLVADGRAAANKRGWYYAAGEKAEGRRQKAEGRSGKTEDRRANPGRPEFRSSAAKIETRPASPELSQPTFIGKLSVNAKSCGFVAGGEGNKDLFIPPQYLDGAVSGDEVEVRVTEPDNERGPAGRILRIVTERAPGFIGEFVILNGRPAVRPLRRDLPDMVPVSDFNLPASDEPEQGDWVEAKLLRPTAANSMMSAVVVKLRPPLHPISRTLDAVMDEYALQPRYTAEQNAAAAKLKPVELNVEDHTQLLALTIDPVDAKDHDDAISLAPGTTPGTVMVGVHIAEVAAYVTPGSWLDAEAAKRCFTAYLPGRTLPMLPHGLAADACSLLAGQDRLAHTVFFEINREDGRILGTRRCHSRIHVKRLLNYDDVQEFLDGKSEGAGWSPEVRHALKELAHVARRLRKNRETDENFLEVAAEEIRIRCEENPPRIVMLVTEKPSESHELVEEFMLAANTAVAEELARCGIPGLYRNHPPPTPADLEGFAAWAADLGLPRIKRFNTRQAMNQFLAGLPDTPMRQLIVREFLKTQTRAGYSSMDKAHFGLGKECYCHFTSPIRRYADLLVHQQLRAIDAKQAGRPAGEVKDLAKRVSELEMNNDYAYFTASDRLKLHYIEQLMLENPGRVLNGVFSRRTDNGTLVYLPEFGNQGLLTQNRAEERFRGSRSHSFKKVADSSGKSGKIGDFIGVRPRRIDCVRGVLELKPA